MAITTATMLRASSFSSGKFGLSAETGFTSAIILQDIAFEGSGKEIPPATNEVGAEIGTGVMGGNIANYTGTFLNNGGNYTTKAIASTITLVNSFSFTDPVLLLTWGFKRNHEAWETGDFKLISLVGGTATVTS